MFSKSSCGVFFVICAVYLSLLTYNVNGKTGLGHDKVVVCYIGTWAVYRENRGSFKLDNVDPNLCTHIVYAFAGLDTTSNSIKSLDPWQDLKDNYGKGNYENATNLKKKYPHLKITLAIGGWNEGSVNYSNMASSPDKRKVFIESVVEFLKKYNFDGLDLDWEYPGKRDGKPEDKANFASLVRELKTEFKKHNFILTAALGASKETIDVAYDVKLLSQYLDLMHMMCYDYHGTWDKVVGANAPLHPSTAADQLSVEFTIEYMLSLGAPPEKLVMGVPFYGRTFVKQIPASPTVHVGAAAKETGFQGQFTKENGFMGYNEICLELSNSSLGWSTHWDEKSMTPYAIKDDRIVMYDDQKSLIEKVRFALNRNLAGVMIWSIDTDDFNGDCSTETDIYMSYLDNLRKLKDTPFFTKALPELEKKMNEKFENKSGDTYRLTANTAYQIENGDINLAFPVRVKNNYPLLRTLNEAIVLSERECFIQNELEKIIKEKEKENEINPEKSNGNPNSANQMPHFGILTVLIFSFVFKAL